MLVQSGGGKVYAVLANNTDYELGVLPQLQVVSTTVFLQIRCRFKALVLDYFDPMLTPKTVLVGGIERSGNTLRGIVSLSTGFTLEKIGTGFPALMAERLVEAAPGFLLPKKGQEEAALYDTDMREDFKTDFAQLVLSAIEPVYPAKDFSGLPILQNPFDMSMAMSNAGTVKSPFAALPGGKVDAGAPVNKVIPGGDDEPAPPSHPEPGEVSKKVLLFGKAPEDAPPGPSQEAQEADPVESGETVPEPQ